MLQACGYPTLMMIKKKDVENAIVIHSLFHNLSTTFPQVINDCCCLSQNNVVFLQLSSIRDKMSNDQQQTYKQLFREQYPRLFHYVMQVTHDEEASRDIVSDTFSQLWQRWETLDVARAPQMLMVLVKHRCVDLLRHRVVHAKYVDYYLHAVGEAYADTNENRELQRKVDLLMAQLGEPTKTVLKKCYFDKKKYVEVAEEMNMSKDMVKRHISKALKLLRNRFRGKNIDDI